MKCTYKIEITIPGMEPFGILGNTTVEQLMSIGPQEKGRGSVREMTEAYVFPVIHQLQQRIRASQTQDGVDG